MQVWQYAASAGNAVLLRRMYLESRALAWLNRRKPQSFEDHHRCFFRYGLVLQDYRFHLAPYSFFRVCRLGRLAALKQWKAEVERIPVVAEVPNAER